MAGGTVADKLACNMEGITDSYGKHVFIITPLRKFLPKDVVYNSVIDIDYSPISSSQFLVCVIETSQRHAWLYLRYHPFDACRSLGPYENKQFVFGLDASATQFRGDPTAQHEFRLNEVATINDGTCKVRFSNNEMNSSIFWNTLTVDYQLIDVVSSNASVVSLTIAVFAFVFPLALPGKPQYSFRFRPPASSSARSSSTKAMASGERDVESRLADAADQLTMSDYLPAP